MTPEEMLLAVEPLSPLELYEKRVKRSHYIESLKISTFTFCAAPMKQFIALVNPPLHLVLTSLGLYSYHTYGYIFETFKSLGGTVTPNLMTPDSFLARLAEIDLYA